jgi:hypothetical protein
MEYNERNEDIVKLSKIDEPNLLNFTTLGGLYFYSGLFILLCWF